MTTIPAHETTTATPEQFVAGLTDFGPGRAKLFPNSADDDLQVHDRAPTMPTSPGLEGTWERLNYDWSDPHKIVLRTTDSNAWANSSTHTYSLTPRSDGRTDIDLVVVPPRQELEGAFLRCRVHRHREELLGEGFHTTVKAIEAQNYGATPNDTA